jgi:hypothetical protein
MRHRSRRIPTVSSRTSRRLPPPSSRLSAAVPSPPPPPIKALGQYSPSAPRRALESPIQSSIPPSLRPSPRVHLRSYSVLPRWRCDSSPLESIWHLGRSFHLSSESHGSSSSIGCLFSFCDRIGLIPNGSNPLLQPPLSGLALNGITSNQTSDPSAANRLQASLSNLATSFELYAGKTPSILSAANITYGSFLDVFAAAAYLTPTSTPTTAILYEVQARLKVAYVPLYPPFRLSLTIMCLSAHWPRTSSLVSSSSSRLYVPPPFVRHSH